MKFNIDTELKVIILEEPTSLKDLIDNLKSMFPTDWDAYVLTEKKPAASASLFGTTTPYTYTHPFPAVITTENGLTSAKPAY